jgi:hypothetical protein
LKKESKLALVAEQKVFDYPFVEVGKMRLWQEQPLADLELLQGWLLQLLVGAADCQWQE